MLLGSLYLHQHWIMQMVVRHVGWLIGVATF